MRWKGFIEPTTTKCAASGTLSIMFSIPRCCPMVPPAYVTVSIASFTWLHVVTLVHQGQLLPILWSPFEASPPLSGVWWKPQWWLLCSHCSQSCKGYNGYNGYSRYLVPHRPTFSGVASTSFQIQIVNSPVLDITRHANIQCNRLFMIFLQYPH